MVKRCRTEGEDMKTVPAKRTIELVKDELNYYEVLLVNERATAQEIDQAFQHLSRLWRPDLNADRAEAVEHFQLICRAHDVLSNPELRRAYDLENQSSTEDHEITKFDDGMSSRLIEWFRADVWRSRMVAGVLTFLGFVIVSYVGDFFSKPTPIEQASKTEPVFSGFASSDKALPLDRVKKGKESPSLLASAEKILAIDSSLPKEIMPVSPAVEEQTRIESPKGEFSPKEVSGLLESVQKTSQEPLVPSEPKQEPSAKQSLQASSKTGEGAKQSPSKEKPAKASSGIKPTAGSSSSKVPFSTSLETMNVQKRSAEKKPDLSSSSDEPDTPPNGFSDSRSETTPEMKNDAKIQENMLRFLNRYTQVYEKKNIKALEELFEKDALENGEAFSSLRPLYQNNFHRIKKFRYDIEILSWKSIEGGLDVMGKFSLDSLINENMHRESNGPLHLILTRHGEDFRIRTLDYQIEATREFVDTVK